MILTLRYPDCDWYTVACFEATSSEVKRNRNIIDYNGKKWYMPFYLHHVYGLIRERTGSKT